jgi:hypothetical protein
MKTNRRFIFLAKLGIVESNDSSGKYEVQRIDQPKEFAIDNELNFEPPLLSSDDEARKIFNSLTHARLEELNNY